MKPLLILSLLGLLAIDASAQEGGVMTREDSIQQARLAQITRHQRQMEIFREMYKENPRAAVDSANAGKMAENLEAGLARLKAYEGNGRIDTLVQIDLSYAGLREVPDWVWKARALEVLILDYNNIKKLPRELVRLTKLKRIYWRGNGLEDFLWVRIARIEGLEKLDISNNLLTRLPMGVKKLEGLKELVMDENFFGEIPVSRLKRADFIKVASFNKSHLLELGENRYDKIGFLEVLKANNSRLTYLHPSLYGISELNELQLQENQLTGLPPGISKLKKLTKLSLYKNEITALPEDIFDLNLTVIDLYYNQLEVVPEAIARLKNLEILFLAHNKIYSLPESIGELDKLAELYLHHNRLSVLPESLSKLQGLNVARVNDNYLVEFPSQFLGMPLLWDLDISNNQITTVPTELEQMDNLKLFTYQENPIDIEAARNAHLAAMISRMMDDGVTCVPRVYREEVTAE